MTHDPSAAEQGSHATEDQEPADSGENELGPPPAPRTAGPEWFHGLVHEMTGPPPEANDDQRPPANEQDPARAQGERPPAGPARSQEPPRRVAPVPLPFGIMTHDLPADEQGSRGREPAGSGKDGLGPPPPTPTAGPEWFHGLVREMAGPPPASNGQASRTPLTGGSGPRPTGPAANPPRPITGPGQPKRPDIGTLLTNLVTKPMPRVEAEPRPATPQGVDPHQLDEAISEPMFSSFFSPGQAKGARERLREPVDDLQGRISELNDQIDSINQTDPAKRAPDAQGSLEGAQRELQVRQQQLMLYANDHCDYQCDVDAPYVKTNDEDDPLDAAADELGPGASRAQVLARARENDAAKPEGEKHSGADLWAHTVLDIGGLAGPAGPVFDAINAAYYGIQGDAANAALSGAAAIPIAGDVAGAGKLGKDGYKLYKGTRGTEEAAEAAGKMARKDAETRARDFVEKNLGKRFDDETPGSMDALTGAFDRSASGTRANAKVPGQAVYTETRGASTELRTLSDLAAREDVRKIRAVPSRSGTRSPDFVVTKEDGSLERVEVTTVTGAPAGRQPRGIGTPKAPTATDIKRAIRRKVVAPKDSTTQFDSRLDGDPVPTGGTLVIGLRGGDDAGAGAAKAVEDMTLQLGRADIREVNFTQPGGQSQRFVRQPDGRYAPQAAPR